MFIINILILITASISIIINNPIMSVIYLISVYILSSLLFIILGYDLIGIIYIIVYVGAIAILLLFVIMMMNLLHITPSITLHSSLSPFLLPSSFSSSFLPSSLTTHSPSFLSLSGPFNQLLSLTQKTLLYTDIGKHNIIRKYITQGILIIIVIVSIYHNVDQFNNSTIKDTIFNRTPGTWLRQITTLDHTTWLLSIINTWDTLTITIQSPLLFSIGFLLYSDGAILLLLLSILLLMVMISIIGLIIPTITDNKS